MRGSVSRREAQGRSADVTPDRGTPLERFQAPQGGSSLLALHRARFVEWEPTAAVASGASGDGTVLAVAREGGDIEVWQTQTWTCITRLCGSRQHATNSIAWLQEKGSGTWRLFTGGLDGSLTEWDILGRRPKHRDDALGGAVWAMAVQPSSQNDLPPRVAVACDDGCLRLFRAEEGQPGLVYDSSLPPLGSRLLSVAWHPKGKVVVAGTANGSLHAWNTETRREILRIHTGDETKVRQDVWALTVLPDGTMVTGDSGGNIQFWDAAHGSLITSLRRHQADVLAIAASPDGSCVFASGADHQVVLVRRIEPGHGRPVRWEYIDSKRPHTHDVRTLTIVNSVMTKAPLLISGGHDAQLFAYRISEFTKEHPTRLTKIPEPPRLQIAPQSREGTPALLLSTHRDCCDLWQLGSDTSHEALNRHGSKPTEGQLVGLSAMPAHLAQLSTSGRGHIVSAALSADGQYIAIADTDGICLYALEHLANGRAPTLRKQHLSALGAVGPIVAVAFAGHRLLMASPTSIVHVVDIDNDNQVSKLEGIKTATRSNRSAAGQAMRSVAAVVSSPDGRFAVLQRSTELHVLRLDPLTHECNIPLEEHGLASVVEFGPTGDVLAVGTASNCLLLYTIPSKELVSVPQQLASVLSEKLAKMPGSISSISFLPDQQRRAALITTPSSLLFVDFQAPAPLPPQSAVGKKRRRTKEGLRISEEPDRAGTNARLLQLNYLCLACVFTSAKSAILVEKDWAQVLEHFPAPVYRHRYGS